MSASPYLLGAIGAVPSESETVISQLARTVFANRGLLYLGTIIATTIILVLATNTAFADFPRLSAIIADDGYMPRQLAYRGSRLVFSRGIMSLTGIASLLIIHLQCKCDGACSALGCGRLSILYTFTGRHGTSLVEAWATPPKRSRPVIAIGQAGNGSWGSTASDLLLLRSSR